MPELPDVERYRRYIDRNAKGRPIRHLSIEAARIVAPLRPAALDRRLRGRTFTEIRRHGKHLFLRVDGDDWLTMHFGLTGRPVWYRDPDDAPPHQRIRFDFADGSHLAYADRRMLGHIGITNDPEAFIAQHRLGPDALSPEFDLDYLRRAVGERRGEIKSFLMNQEIVAGIGNIFSDEILFRAHLHPRTGVQRLGESEISRLLATTKAVLQAAIDREAGAEEFLDRHPPGSLIPCRHRGGACPACGHPLETLRSGGRTAYFCPRCQPERRETS